MDERKACERLKQRFEEAGFRIAENVDYAEHGLRFDLDGYDAGAKVGYEYVTDEAGDGWDVDEAVIAQLGELRTSGALFVLVVDEDEAPDAPALDRAIDEFLAELRSRGVVPGAKGPTAPPPVPKAAKAPKGARKPKKR
jgi:hypothetical protein